MPIQKRSLEKRERIVEKGFELMCENGYYETTTSDIAKYAGVSVGIIYQYFNDKKEIFLEGVKNYSTSIMFPALDVIYNEKFSNNLEDTIFNMIDNYINAHKISKKSHEELMAMTHLDSDVSKIFKQSEIDTTNKIIERLEKKNFCIKNSKEKVHIILNLVDNLCHEIVYHRHSELNYEIMKKEVVNLILNLINQT